MTKDRIRLIYLALIEGYAGKSTWYNLGRSLDLQGIPHDDLMDVIGALAGDGLITRGEGEKMEQYTITALGRERLVAHKRESLRRIERRILELVAASPGRLGWYNLRNLKVKGDAAPDFHDLVAVLDALIAEGFLTAEATPGIDAKAYTITAKGQARLGSREFKFEHGQDVAVAETAPKEFRPGAVASVCGMRQLDGQNLYLVEFSDGEAVEIPERFLTLTPE